MGLHINTIFATFLSKQKPGDKLQTCLRLINSRLCIQLNIYEKAYTLFPYVIDLPTLSAPRGIMTSANFLVCMEEEQVIKLPRQAVKILIILPASKTLQRLVLLTWYTVSILVPNPFHVHECL